MFLNKAKAITTYGEWLFLEDWLKYNSNERYINTINGKFPIPQKIVYFKALTPHHFRVRLSRHNLYIRDMGTCQYCGCFLTLKDATRDHVIPTSKGGKTIWDNIVLSCKKCNQSKGSNIWKPYKKPYQPSSIEIKQKMQKVKLDET